MDASPALDQLVEELSAVDHALRRLDDGSYGTCEVCATTIDDGRLEQVPTAVRCRACEPAAAPPSG